MGRAALAIGITLAVVLLLNVITVRTLLAAHPNRRAVIWVVTLVGNAMWALLPFIFTVRTTAPVRVLRALLGPPWFSWMIFLILYSAVAILLGIAWLLLARHRMSFGAFAHAPSTIYLSVLGVLTVIGIYQALVPLRIERVPVRIADLPSALQGFRIAVVSDLHVGLFTRPSRLRRISAEVNALAPNMLAVTGDMIDDDPHFVPKLLRGLDEVRSETPMFAVLGNHEIYGDPHGVIRALEGTRLQLLLNSGTTLPSGLFVAGISDYAARSRGGEKTADLRPDMTRAVQQAPAGATVVLLSHQPLAFEEARQKRIPLTIVGHTHGGQCGIRSLRWSLAGLFLPYDMGLYERDGCQLYVNTGTGYWVVPFRLGMSPEITLIELH